MGSIPIPGTKLQTGTRRRRTYAVSQRHDPTPSKVDCSVPSLWWIDGTQMLPDGGFISRIGADQRTADVRHLATSNSTTSPEDSQPVHTWRLSDGGAAISWKRTRAEYRPAGSPN